MKKLTLILFILSSYFGLSQSEKKWLAAIGIETYQNISYNTVDETNEIAVSFHNSDKRKYSYSFGINAKVLELNKFTFISSLTYTNIGFNQPLIGGYGLTIDPQLGYVYTQPKPGEPASGNFEWRFNYIDLGLGTNFNILNKKTKLYFSVTPELNYLINFKHISTQYDINGTLLKKDSDDRTNYYEMNRINISLNIGLGCEFNIGKQINMFTQLNYKQMLITPTPKLITKDKLYSYGLKLGLRYNLN